MPQQTEEETALVRGLTGPERPILRLDGSNFEPGVVRELDALARLLVDELQPAGVIELRFSLADERAGRRRSRLGCHELRVLQPAAWVERLHHWALVDGSCFSDGLDDDPVRRESRWRYSSVYIVELLRKMLLQPQCKFRNKFKDPVAFQDPMPLCWYVWENNILDSVWM